MRMTCRSTPTSACRDKKKLVIFSCGTSYRTNNINNILFYSDIFHSIPLFHYIPLYSILFYSILFYSTPFYSILLYFIIFHYIPCYSILFHSITLHYIPFNSIPFYSTQFCSISYGAITLIISKSQADYVKKSTKT